MAFLLLQQGLLAGLSPLGPGAAPVERAVAFTRAYLDYGLKSPELVLMSETASRGARFRIGAFRVWHRHLAICASRPVPSRRQAAVLAHAMLAPLGAEHLIAQLDADADRESVISGLVLHTRLVIGGASSRR